MQVVDALVNDKGSIGPLYLAKVFILRFAINCLNDQLLLVPAILVNYHEFRQHCSVKLLSALEYPGIGGTGQCCAEQNANGSWPSMEQYRTEAGGSRSRLVTAKNT